MTLIGAFLTALVMAREWERGTLEALFVTPVRPTEILIAKIVPYFMVGMIGLALCLLAARFLFEVPVQGSLPLLLLSSVPVSYTHLDVYKRQAVGNFGDLPDRQPAILADATGRNLYPMPAGQKRDRPGGHRHPCVADGINSPTNRRDLIGSAGGARVAARFRRAVIHSAAAHARQAFEPRPELVGSRWL